MRRKAVNMHLLFILNVMYERNFSKASKTHEQTNDVVSQVFNLFFSLFVLRPVECGILVRFAL